MRRVLPILFNEEMVIGTLEGRRKATRRVVHPKPILQPYGCWKMGKTYFSYNISKEEIIPFHPIYAYMPLHIGDIMYVQEAWTIHEEAVDGIIYKARCPEKLAKSKKWYSALYMPKEFARIWLKVTDIRIELLQDMTLDDFVLEGVIIPPEAYNDPDNAYWQARNIFSETWDSTIKKSELELYGWDANPWVWAIEFEWC